MSGNMASIRKNGLFVLIILVVIALLSLSGCGSATQKKDSSTASSDKLECKVATFQGISFDIPSNVELKVSDETSALYGLEEKAENPYALDIFCECSPGDNSTAQSWYKAFSEFEECELVSANGIDICIQSEEYSSSDYVAVSFHFSCDEAFYSIIMSYDPSSKVSYGKYVQSFYKTIKSTDAESANAATKQAVTPANEAIDWSKADQYVGRTATFCGQVVDAEYAASSTSSPTFLDLGVAYPNPNRLSIVIWGKNRSSFASAPEKMYEGKTIAVTGEVYMYDGVCNIEVSSPKQIEIIK